MDGWSAFFAWVTLRWGLLAGIGAALVAVAVALVVMDRRAKLRSLQRSQKFCRTCGGTGKSDGRKCELCNGSGIPPVCPICDGDGRVEAEKRCSYCMGTGVVVS